jgi:hypothetical protein
MKTWGDCKQSATLFISALAGGERLVSRTGRFNPGERTPLHLLDRRLGGHKGKSGCCGIEKVCCSCRESNPSPSLYLLSYSGSWKGCWWIWTARYMLRYSLSINPEFSWRVWQKQRQVLGRHASKARFEPEFPDYKVWVIIATFPIVDQWRRIH